MNTTIYLTVDRSGVQHMRKSLTDARRGECIVQLDIEMPPEAFSPPVLRQKVVVNDWREGIDLEDVRFKNGVITEEEAASIRAGRIEKMKAVLEEQGYEVTKPETEGQAV